MLSAANASVFDLRGARRISPPTYEADAVAFTEGADPLALWMGTAPSTAIDREENLVAGGSSGIVLSFTDI